MNSERCPISLIHRVKRAKTTCHMVTWPTIEQRHRGPWERGWVMSRISDLKCDLHKAKLFANNSVQDRSMLVTLLLLSPFLFQAPSVDSKVSHIDNIDMAITENHSSFQLKLPAKIMV